MTSDDPPRAVLVTGGTGFLGTHVMRALVDAGQRWLVVSKGMR